jgi:putative ABC transport system permease protein
MTFGAWLSNLCRNLTRRRQLERDVDDEVRSTFDLLVDEKLRAGQSSVDARRAATTELGGIEPLKEQIRVARTGALMDAVARDVRFAARMLAKSRGFTCAAVATLALGIGANTTIFSFVHAFLLTPLPLENLSRLVSVYMTDERNPGERGISRQNFYDLRERNEVFDELTAEGSTYASLAGGEADPQRIIAAVVAGNYFSTLGAKPILGRGFVADEDRTEGARLVAVLSYSLWRTRYGGDPDIVGGTISLNNHAFAVVGVMPAGFRGIASIGGPALWVPIMTYPVITSGQTLQGLGSRRYDWFWMTARLKAGVTLQQAEASLKTIARQLEQAYPNDNAGRSVGIRPLSALSPNQRQTILTSVGLLMTIVGLVLFIACTNVANLMLARAGVRQKEMAIREAMGASRGRLIRQLLTEGFLLAVVSGLVGLLVARWAQAVLWSYRPDGFGADFVDLRLNLQVLAFTAAVSLFTCVLFSLVPALRASRPDVIAELKGATSRIDGMGRRIALRQALIVSQVALSLVALITAGLFVRSLQTVQQIEPGFDVARLALIHFDLGTQGNGEAQGREFQRKAVERASTVGGVDAVVLGDLIPLHGGGQTRTVFIEGEDLTDRRNGRILPTGIVGAGYFKTLGIPVVRGREFNDDDRATAPLVAMVNERLASRLWPGQDALRKRVKLFNTDFYEVVGIVRDTKLESLGNDPEPILYRPLAQVYQPTASLFVRATRPGSVLGTVRSQVQQLDPRLPIDVWTLSDVVYMSLWTPRMAAWLLTLLGVISLLLAVIGVYGVMAYSVSQRTRELGLRVALGADRGDVIRLVVGEGFRLTLAGIALGLATALAASRLVAGLLYGSATDPVTFVVVPAILAGAVLAASYLPALRATRIEPTVALRTDA